MFLHFFNIVAKNLSKFITFSQKKQQAKHSPADGRIECLFSSVTTSFGLIFQL